jgi:hypothetical protein
MSMDDPLHRGAINPGTGKLSHAMESGHIENPGRT